MAVHNATETLTNPKAERIRRVADLARSHGRKKTGRFLIEGPQAVREAVRWRADAVLDCYAQVSEQGDDGYLSDTVLRIVIEAEAQGLYVHAVSAEVMRKMSTDCQGIVAVGSMEAMRYSVDTFEVQNQADDALQHATSMEDSRADSDDFSGKRRSRSQEFDRSIDADAANPLPTSNLKNTVAAFWQVRDPGNAGTVIRAADAAGCRAVVFVDDCVDRFNPKVVRSTAGSLFHLPVLTMSTDEFFAWAVESGVDVMAADVYGTAQTKPESLVDVLAERAGITQPHTVQAPQEPLNATGDDTDTGAIQATSTVSVPVRHAVLFGNEARGLPVEVLERVQRIVSIPLYGKAESLNLATSSAVLLYSLAMA